MGFSIHCRPSQWLWKIKQSGNTPSDAGIFTSPSFLCKCVVLIRMKARWRALYLSGRDDKNVEVCGSWGRLEQIRGQDATATLWRQFFKVWQLRPTSREGLRLSWSCSSFFSVEHFVTLHATQTHTRTQIVFEIKERHPPPTTTALFFCCCCLTSLNRFAGDG